MTQPSAATLKKTRRFLLWDAGLVYANANDGSMQQGHCHFLAEQCGAPLRRLGFYIEYRLHASSFVIVLHAR